MKSRNSASASARRPASERGNTRRGRRVRPILFRDEATSLFDYLEGGDTLDEFLRQFPSVKRDQAIAAPLARDTLSLVARQVISGFHYLLIVIPEYPTIRSMKTTVDIPEGELRDAMRFTKAKTKREAVVKVLEEFNRRRRMADLVKYSATFGDRFPTNDEIEAADAEHDRKVHGRSHR